MQCGRKKEEDEEDEIEHTTRHWQLVQRILLWGKKEALPSLLVN
jgi:hypothetical protein